MQVPLHALIVHIPVVLSLVVPLLVLIFAFMMKRNKITPKGWLIIVGMQLAITVTGYVSLETGETEEDIVQRVVDKKIIHEHEEAAEIFVGSTVIVLVLAIAAFFVRADLHFPIHLLIAGLGFVSVFLGIRTGQLGGELVYEHGAASAYAQVIASPQEEPEGILPTPNENTSETPVPVDENESLKTDDTDYGNTDEVDEIDDEDSKQED